jgi:hypothetical protein
MTIMGNGLRINESFDEKRKITLKMKKSLGKGFEAFVRGIFCSAFTADKP